MYYIIIIYCIFVYLIGVKVGMWIVGRKAIKEYNRGYLDGMDYMMRNYKGQIQQDWKNIEFVGTTTWIYHGYTKLEPTVTANSNDKVKKRRGK